MTDQLYTTQLQAGLGLIEETRKLLDLWTAGMSATELRDEALASGIFPNVTYRRLNNIVTEGFKPRYLVAENNPANYLKKLMGNLGGREFEQLLFLYTCRAHAILADFIRQVYWGSYMAGKAKISTEDARAFIVRASEDGKLMKSWSDGTVQRVARYLTGCCADFGLLQRGMLSEREILSYRIEPTTVVYLAYELHFSGIGDNRILNHPDWALFGLEWNDVLSELKRQALKGGFIIQTAGNVTKIGWQHPNMEAVIDVISRS